MKNTAHTIKVKTVVAFLRSKGWILEKTTERYFVLIPPTIFKPEPTARFYIPLPKYEQAVDFPMVMDKIVNSLSVIYETEKKSLNNLFSKTIDQIKEDIEEKKAIVEFA